MYMYVSSGVIRNIFGAFAIFFRVRICKRSPLCLLLHGRLDETEFGRLQLLCCKVVNIDGSPFNILVNKLLEYIFTKVQTEVGKFRAGIFQGLAQRSYGIAMFG